MRSSRRLRWSIAPACSLWTRISLESRGWTIIPGGRLASGCIAERDDIARSEAWAIKRLAESPGTGLTVVSMHQGIDPVVATVMADSRATPRPQGHGAAGVQDIAAANPQPGAKAFRSDKFRDIAPAQVSE